MQAKWKKWLGAAAVVGVVAFVWWRGRGRGLGAPVKQPSKGKGKHDWRSHIEAVLRDEPSLLPSGWTVDNVLRWIDYESGGNPYSITPKGNERGLTQIHEDEWDAMGGDTPGWRKLKGDDEAAIDYAWHARTALQHLSYLDNQAGNFLAERMRAHNLADDDAWTGRSRVWFTKLWHALPSYAREVFLSAEKRKGEMPDGPDDLEAQVLGRFDTELEKFAKYGKPTRTVADAWNRLTRGPGRVAYGNSMARNT